MMNCLWCEGDGAISSANNVFWELPDGSRSIEITNVPSVKCLSCGMEYQEEELIEEIETQLLLIDTKQIGKTISYEEFRKLPRLLKRNYFKL